MSRDSEGFVRIKGDRIRICFIKKKQRSSDVCQKMCWAFLDTLPSNIKRYGNWKSVLLNFLALKMFPPNESGWQLKENSRSVWRAEDWNLPRFWRVKSFNPGPYAYYWRSHQPPNYTLQFLLQPPRKLTNDNEKSSQIMDISPTWIFLEIRGLPFPSYLLNEDAFPIRIKRWFSSDTAVLLFTRGY